MQQLIIGVLSDGTGRAPQHWRGVVFKQLSRWRDALAVALHGQLLQEVRQMSELLGIGQDNMGVGAEIVGLPELQKCHDHGHVVSG